MLIVSKGNQSSDSFALKDFTLQLLSQKRILHSTPMQRKGSEFNYLAQCNAVRIGSQASYPAIYYSFCSVELFFLWVCVLSEKSTPKRKIQVRWEKSWPVSESFFILDEGCWSLVCRHRTLALHISTNGVWLNSSMFIESWNVWAWGSLATTLYRHFQVVQSCRILPSKEMLHKNRYKKWFHAELLVFFFFEVVVGAGIWSASFISSTPRDLVTCMTALHSMVGSSKTRILDYDSHFISEIEGIPIFS